MNDNQLTNEIPQVQIYENGSNRVDITIEKQIETGQISLMWQAQIHLWEATITLNQTALELGFFIEQIQQGNCIKFKGHASQIAIWNVSPGEQLQVYLFQKL